MVALTELFAALTTALGLLLVGLAFAFRGDVAADAGTLPGEARPVAGRGAPGTTEAR